MIDWYSIYVTRMNNRYREKMWIKYKIFMNHVFKQFPNIIGSNIAEFGCGAANIARLLNENFDFLPTCKFYLLDNDYNMLKLAKQNIDALKNCRLHKHDIRLPFTVGNIDLIFSHGVLEHFSDKDINLIIKNQLSITKNLVHYVPSFQYKEPSFGDERLMSTDEWFDICSPTKIIKFNSGYDLILIWE